MSKMPLQTRSPSRTYTGSDPTYTAITAALCSLEQRGMLARFNGECIAASDILQHELHQRGVSSQLIECQLSVVSTDARREMRWSFVGFRSNFDAAGLDTHVVVIVQSETPWIIDLSIAGVFAGSAHCDRPWIVEPLQQGDQVVLSRYEFADMVLTYHPKHDHRLMGLHGKTLRDRLVETAQTHQGMSRIQRWLAVALLITAINMMINISLIYLNWIQIDLVEQTQK